MQGVRRTASSSKQRPRAGLGEKFLPFFLALAFVCCPAVAAAKTFIVFAPRLDVHKLHLCLCTFFFFPVSHATALVSTAYDCNCYALVCWQGERVQVKLEPRRDHSPDWAGCLTNWLYTICSSLLSAFSATALNVHL